MNRELITNLKLGQRIWAVIHDQLNSGALIISYGGELLRVENHSRTMLKVGQRVMLTVNHLSPLGFRLVTNPSELRRREIDLTI